MSMYDRDWYREEYQKREQEKRKREKRSRALGAVFCIILFVGLVVGFLWLNRKLWWQTDSGTAAAERGRTAAEDIFGGGTAAGGDDEWIVTPVQSTSGEVPGFSMLEAQKMTPVPEDAVLVAYTGDDDAFRAELSAAIRERQPNICIKDKTFTSMQDFYDLEYGCFWLNQCAVYQVERDFDGERAVYQVFSMDYFDLTEEEIEIMIAQVDEAAGAILAMVPEGADAWTAAKVIHDALCASVTYDDTLQLPYIHTLYGALVNHAAVCSGYTSAYQFLLDRLGIDGVSIYSDIHAWNAVDVPSAERYVDVTWDDYDLVDSRGVPYIGYDFFFVGYDEMQRIEEHYVEGEAPAAADPAESVPYNYYERTGFLADTYDPAQLTAIFAAQYATGTNYLTVRFREAADYEIAKQWSGESSELLFEILRGVGYEGAFLIWKNDEMQTVSIGLYPDTEF